MTVKDLTALDDRGVSLRSTSASRASVLCIGTMAHCNSFTRSSVQFVVVYLPLTAVAESRGGAVCHRRGKPLW